jgi:hypothetical protein
MNKRLQTLDVRDNRIGNTGRQALAATVAKSQTLTTFLEGGSNREPK